MSKLGFIVVIGASAGGMNALSELVSNLKPGMNAAIFIVMHLSKTAVSEFLIKKLQPKTPFRCIQAEDNMPIEADHIYVAKPNHHLIVKTDFILLGSGPEENQWRPSIDVLFRSAAAAYNSSVIGIILTGLLNDGTIGMSAIEKAGGATIVQDPSEAEFPELPISVLEAMDVDHCVRLTDMGKLLEELTRMPVDPNEVPSDIVNEAAIAEQKMGGYESVEKLGDPAVYACPECGGSLWKLRDKVNGDRYRCHIGHAYTDVQLLERQNEVMESTLWVAMRLMEERKKLLEKLEADNVSRGYHSTALSYAQQSKHIQYHIDALKKLLFATQSHSDEKV